MNGIIWLASYPKSGNTWLRVFLANLQRDQDTPVDINSLERSSAHARQCFDLALGYEAGDLTHEEVDLLRPEVYRYLAARAEQPIIFKVHDAYTILSDGQPLFPPEVTAGVVYLVRDPRDVCVSYAHFQGGNYDRILALMADPHGMIAGPRDRLILAGLRQRLLTWSQHVLSWVDAPGLRKLVLRYETMLAQPLETFTAVAAFLGMTQEPARIRRAIAFSSLRELQRQESQDGFREASAPHRAFFRKGKAGSWREVLTDAQVRRMIEDHRTVMQRFGYLTDAEEPVF